MSIKQLIKKITLADKILLTTLVLIALAAYILPILNTRNLSNDTIILKQNDSIILQLTQKEIRTGGIFDFEFEGGTGQIEVKGKKVRMLPMAKSICPQAICSNTGWIEGYPQTIVCMPNRLVVSFISENSKFDAITF